MCLHTCTHAHILVHMSKVQGYEMHMCVSHYTRASSQGLARSSPNFSELPQAASGPAAHLCSGHAPTWAASFLLGSAIFLPPFPSHQA